MTLNQLSAMRAWMVANRHGRPVENHAWDAVLTLWLMGWMGAPAFIVLDDLWAELACVALFFTPRIYLWLRHRLHQRRRVRCDWLVVLQPPAGGEVA